MVIPVVFLLLVVVSPTAAIIDTDGIQNFPDFNTDFGGIGGGGDGNLGLGILGESKYYCQIVKYSQSYIKRSPLGQ